MRRTGKWLAVLLSVTMLAGTAPVYGADISVESDFSSEISGEDSLSDDLGESEITEEPADENTEITEEADTDEASGGQCRGEEVYAASHAGLCPC